jgi:transcriptional regulator with XRE-family HTH domain
MSTPTYTNLPDNLKKLRKSKKLTLAQLAALSGLTKQSLSMIENQITKNPSLLTLVPLANALGVTIDELIK